MFTALQAFIKCDCYTIMSELLTTHKQAIKDRKETTKKVNAVWHLLDAHVFAKVNNFNTSTNFLLKYLQLTCATVNTTTIYSVVETAFYQAMLSICIGMYKETHKGVHIPAHKFHYVNVGNPDKFDSVSLQQVWCKPAQMLKVKNSLAWMESLCTSVSESAEAHLEIFESAMFMVQTCAKNLLSDQILEIKDSMAKLYEFTVYGKLDHINGRLYADLKDFEQIKFAKNAMDAKKFAKRIADVKLRISDKPRYVTVSVADRKKQTEL